MIVGELWRRLVFFFRRGKFDRDLAEEMENHVAMKERARVEHGMPPEEARHAARREFGNALLLRERSHDAWGWRAVEILLGDLRYGARMLRRSPGFTLVAVLTLALGIGANTAIFSAVNGILLVPLPYAHPSRLVTVGLNQIAYPFTFAQFRALRQQCTALEHVTWLGIDSGSGSVSFTGGQEPEKISSASASGEFFSLLGVQPLLGRYILPRDTQPGNDHVAVLNYRLWMTRFGGDPRIVGRSISLNHKLCTIIGVMPRNFGLGINWDYRSSMENPALLWLPLPASPHAPQDRMTALFIARLRSGATLEEAKAQLRVFTARYSQTLPAYLQNRSAAFQVRKLSLGINQRVRTGLLILWGAVGFVLLMACVNITSLLVARSWTRQRELAIRKALGATRLRIVRQLLSESLLLAIAGGALGLLFALWGIHVLRVMAPPNTPRLDWVQLGANVFWFTAGISLLAAVLVGLAPALQATSRRAGPTLKGGMGGSFAELALRRTHRLRSALVVMEVLLAVIVVAGGALMGRSFYKLMNLNTGIRASHVITMNIQGSLMPSGGSPQGRAGNRPRGTQKSGKGKSSQSADKNQGTTEHVTAAGENLLDAVRSLPGVQQVALSSGGVFHGSVEVWPGFRYPGGPRDLDIYIEGHGHRHLLLSGVAAESVTPNYFATLGIRLLRGRDFEPSDLAGPPVAIVSESFARVYIPGNALGKYFSVEKGPGGRYNWTKVIGVVNDVRDQAVYGNFKPPLVFYRPLSLPSPFLTLVARTSANPTVMVPAIEHAVRSTESDAKITRVETVNQILARSSAEPRFQTMLLGSFGALGLLLAIVGVYGVISYSVVQRTHEIGVRMAMGAQRENILRMVLREGMVLAVSGIVLGIAGALVLTRFLRSMLFEIQPTDPATFAGVAILLALAALAACYIPARRAMKVDPMEALRYE